MERSLKSVKQVFGSHKQVEPNSEVYWGQFPQLGPLMHMSPQEWSPSDTLILLAELRAIDDLGLFRKLLPD